MWDLCGGVIFAGLLALAFGRALRLGGEDAE